MQHATAMRALSSLEDAQRYVETQLPAHVLPEKYRKSKAKNGNLKYELRVGQDGMIRMSGNRQTRRVIAKFITGYGKTIGIVGAHAARRVVDPSIDRLLVVVPNIPLLDSHVEEAGDIYRQFTGQDTEIEEFGDPRVVHNVRSGKVKIVIANIQALIFDKSGWKDLLDAGGKWTVAFDEIQYYAAKRDNKDLSAWSKCADDIMKHPSVGFVVGVSATPVRSDGKKTLFGDWDLEISPKVALEEKAIRRVETHLQNYDLDVTLDDDTTPTRLNTAQIAEMAAAEKLTIPEWEIRHKVRYNSKYVSALIDDAYAVLALERFRSGNACMMVFAMSVEHAKHVTSVFNAAYKHESGAPVAVYIGDANAVDRHKNSVGKSSSENKKAIEAFKKSSIDNDNPYILVQVNMAGVGFNHPPACVGLFLNAIGDTVQLEQEVGRILRYTVECPVAFIFAGDDHPGADLFKRMMDEDESAPKAPHLGGGGGGGGARPPYFPSWALIDVTNRGSKIYFPWGAVDPNNVSKEEITLMKEELGGVSEDAVLRAMQKVFAKEQKKQTMKERIKDAKGIVELALQSVVNHMCWRRGFDMPPQNYRADVRTKVNTMWKSRFGRGHDEMTVDDFRKKHKWLEQLAESIRDGSVPGWMP